MRVLVLVLTILLAPKVAAAQTTIFLGAAQPHTLVSYLWRPDYIGKKPEGITSRYERGRHISWDACQIAKQTAEADLQNRGWVWQSPWFVKANPETGSTLGGAYACEVTR